MQITRIELQNIKSYEDETIEFAPGTNAICGENGAGKSTLLEAIGLTMFGYPPRPAGILREGTQSGSITLAFIANDEREYEIIRHFGSSNAYYVRDPETNRKLVEGKANVRDWVCQRMGLPLDTDLAALFSDAIGVPQGLLSAIFLEGKNERHSKFDPLLRVNEYQDAWDYLREVQGHLEDALNEHRVCMADLEARTEELPYIERRLEESSRAIEEDHTRLLEATDHAQKLKEQAAGFEKQRAEIDQAARQLELLRERIAAKHQQVQQAHANLQEALQAAHHLEAAEPGHRAYIQAQSAIEELEKQRTERDGLRQRCSVLGNELSRIEERIRAGRQKLAEIALAEQQVQQLKPLVEMQEKLEAQLKEEESRASRYVEFQNLIQRERESLNEIEAELSRTAQELTVLAALREQAEQTERLEQRLAEIMATIGHVRAQLSQALEARTAVEGGVCPFLGEACRNMAEGVTLTDYFDAQVAAYQQQLGSLQQNQHEIERELRSARDAASRFSMLPRIQEEQARLQKRRDESMSRLTALATEAAGLADAMDRVQEIKTQLTNLGDHRSAYTVAQAQAAQRSEVEASLSADHDKRNQLADEMASLDAQLQTYIHLDECLEAQRSVLRRHEADHQTYLRHQHLAQQVPQWQEALAKAQHELAQAEEEAKEVQAAYEQALAGYDAAEHQRVTEALAQTNAEVIALTERLRHQEAQLAEWTARRDTLAALAAKLEEVRRQYASDQEVLAFLDFARDLIRQAGPYVTEALVRMISQEAARIFSAIMNDYTMRLVWNKEYEISVEKAGNTRTFRQLSGGEQMAAAIAVRLALLREISNLDIAFFDEPTANLDETRRESLADQILHIRGFSQIFVISHDDTFERVTDHTVRIHKENGVSRVMN